MEFTPFHCVFQLPESFILIANERQLDGLWVQAHLEAEQPRVRNEHLSRVICDRPLRKYTRCQPPGACRHARGGGIVHA